MRYLNKPTTAGVAVRDRPLHVLPFLKGKSAQWIAITVLAGAALTPGLSSAQMARVDADPDLPTKEGFDIGRAIFWEAPNFVPLRNPEWQSLRGARRAGAVSDDTPVMVFEVGRSTLVLVSSQMAYHHVAQGEVNGEPWMVTF